MFRSLLSKATLVLLSFQVGLPSVIVGVLNSSNEVLSIVSLKFNPSLTLIGTPLAPFMGRLELRVGAVLSEGFGSGLGVDGPPQAKSDRAKKNKPKNQVNEYFTLTSFLLFQIATATATTAPPSSLGLQDIGRAREKKYATLLLTSKNAWLTLIQQGRPVWHS